MSMNRTLSPFEQAFASARKQHGPGGLFEFKTKSGKVNLFSTRVKAEGLPSRLEIKKAIAAGKITRFGAGSGTTAALSHPAPASPPAPPVTTEGQFHTTDNTNPSPGGSFSGGLALGAAGGALAAIMAKAWKASGVAEAPEPPVSRISETNPRIEFAKKWAEEGAPAAAASQKPSVKPEEDLVTSFAATGHGGEPAKPRRGGKPRVTSENPAPDIDEIVAAAGGKPVRTATVRTPKSTTTVTTTASRTSAREAAAAVADALRDVASSARGAASAAGGAASVAGAVVAARGAAAAGGVGGGLDDLEAAINRAVSESGKPKIGETPPSYGGERRAPQTFAAPQEPALAADLSEIAAGAAAKAATDRAASLGATWAASRHRHPEKAKRLATEIQGLSEDLRAVAHDAAKGTPVPPAPSSLGADLADIATNHKPQTVAPEGLPPIKLPGSLGADLAEIATGAAKRPATPNSLAEDLGAAWVNAPTVGKKAGIARKVKGLSADLQAVARGAAEKTRARKAGSSDVGADLTGIAAGAKEDHIEKLRQQIGGLSDEAYDEGAAPATMQQARGKIGRGGDAKATDLFDAVEAIGPGPISDPGHAAHILGRARLIEPSTLGEVVANLHQRGYTGAASLLYRHFSTPKNRPNSPFSYTEGQAALFKDVYAATKAEISSPGFLGLKAAEVKQHDLEQERKTPLPLDAPKETYTVGSGAEIQSRIYPVGADPLSPPSTPRKEAREERTPSVWDDFMKGTRPKSAWDIELKRRTRASRPLPDAAPPLSSAADAAAIAGHAGASFRPHSEDDEIADAIREAAKDHAAENAVRAEAAAEFATLPEEGEAEAHNQARVETGEPQPFDVKAQARDAVRRASGQPEGTGGMASVAEDLGEIAKSVVKKRRRLPKGGGSALGILAAMALGKGLDMITSPRSEDDGD